MKTLYNLGFALIAGSLFYVGVRYEFFYATVFALTLAYLVIVLLKSRFLNARTFLLNEAERLGKVTLNQKSVYYPYSNSDGVFILKNEEEFKQVVVSGRAYFIKKMVSYPVKSHRVKPYELENKYFEYVFVSRMALRLTTLMATLLAGYHIYTGQQYGYLVFPIGFIAYHIFLYSSLIASAREMFMGRILNRDRGYLDELMRFYGVVFIGLENPVPITEVLPTGAVVVRFEDTPDAPRYFVTLEERVYIEELAEDMTSQAQQNENSLSSQ